METEAHLTWGQGEVPHLYWFCGIFWNEKVEAGGEWQEEVQPSETPDFPTHQ